jgi:DNA-binding Xre family transcriptional regulator
MLTPEEKKKRAKAATAKLWHGAVKIIRDTPPGRGVQGKLAERFGVSQAAISQAKSGKTWTGVE